MAKDLLKLEQLRRLKSPSAFSSRNMNFRLEHSDLEAQNPEHERIIKQSEEIKCRLPTEGSELTSH